MITTLGDIRTACITRLGISTSSTFYTDTIFNAWIKSADRWATSYKKWPFTEGRINTTYTGVEEWNFEGIKSDSIRTLQIGGKRLRKLNFEDYQIFREEYPDDEDRVYTDFANIVMINPQIDLSGTLTAWFQYPPVDMDTTEENSTTVFSNHDDEGNEAIVEEVMSYAALREKREDKATFHHNRAIQILEKLGENIGNEQFNYHTHKARGGIWEHFDVLNGGQGNNYKENQF